MAIYKVWLTVQDNYGNIKEIDGGNIDVELAAFTPEELTQIKASLPLDEYIKRENLNTELDAYATDEELANNTTIKYSSFELK